MLNLPADYVKLLFVYLKMNCKRVRQNHSLVFVVQDLGLANPDDPDDVIAVRGRVRSALIDIAVDAPANDSDSMEQITDVMIALLDQPAEVTINAQVQFL